MEKTNKWIPCRIIDQSFIPELNGCKMEKYFVTYKTRTGKLYVTTETIYGGRIQSKRINGTIIAYMSLPEPYKGEQGT